MSAATQIGEAYAAAFCRGDAPALRSVLDERLLFDGPAGRAEGLLQVLRLWRVWFEHFSGGLLRTAYVGKGPGDNCCVVTIRGPQIEVTDEITVGHSGRATHIKRVVRGNKTEITNKLHEAFQRLQLQADDLERRMEEEAEIARAHLVNSRLLLTSMKISSTRRQKQQQWFGMPPALLGECASSDAPSEVSGSRRPSMLLQTSPRQGLHMKMHSTLMHPQAPADPAQIDADKEEDRVLAELKGELDGIRDAHARKERLWAQLMQKKDEQLAYTLKREKAHVAKLREKVSLLVEQLEALLKGVSDAHANLHEEARRRTAQLFGELLKDGRLDKLQLQQRWLVEEFLREVRVSVEIHQGAGEKQSQDVASDLARLVAVAREAHEASSGSALPQQTGSSLEVTMLEDQIRGLRVDLATALAAVEEHKSELRQRDEALQQLREQLAALQSASSTATAPQVVIMTPYKPAPLNICSPSKAPFSHSDAAFLKAENARLVRELNQLRESLGLRAAPTQHAATQTDRARGSKSGAAVQKQAKRDSVPTQPQQSARRLSPPGKRRHSGPALSEPSGGSSDSDDAQSPVTPAEVPRRRVAFCYVCGSGPQEAAGRGPVRCELCQTTVYFGARHKREMQRQQKEKELAETGRTSPSSPEPRGSLAGRRGAPMRAMDERQDSVPPEERLSAPPVATLGFSTPQAVRQAHTRETANNPGPFAAAGTGMGGGFATSRDNVGSCLPPLGPKPAVTGRPNPAGGFRPRPPGYNQYR
eukprot:TRINITY_DN60181_c0_g1_i1.p1 TRINITY_DN60181_c0_g1~~TRINITY_DN60181_c0_g1_i1.p1  ORF type:complete len:760 (+),score=235.44 TRINITY_DN60181_c0_g1_i1:126-2405(+)